MALKFHIFITFPLLLPISHFPHLITERALGRYVYADKSAHMDRIVLDIYFANDDGPPPTQQSRSLRSILGEFMDRCRRKRSRI